MNSKPTAMLFMYIYIYTHINIYIYIQDISLMNLKCVSRSVVSTSLQPHEL